MTLKHILLTATVLTSASLAHAQFNFNPREVRIESVTFAGNGCPAGSARAVLAPDASAITIMYDQFEAQIGPATAVAQKKCDLVVKLSKPKLFSFAIESADFRGFVYLERGARATQDVKLETGHGDLAKVNLNLGTQSWLGPVNQNYTLTAVKPHEGLKYLSCLQPKKEGRLRVKSTITLENGRNRSEGLITVDSVDGRLVQRYNLRWMNCVNVGVGLLDGLIRLSSAR